MKTVLYKNESRGHADHGWLVANHTFSFADYYDPKRMNFGTLRVLNDDVIKGAKGFATHPHTNMEIITIPLWGSLRHEDSMGNGGVINAGDVQVMSAGKGILHSEYNANSDKSVNIFQIWVLPNIQDVEPRYQQKDFNFRQEPNRLHTIVSPNGDDGSLWIHQDAWFSIGVFDKGKEIEYELKSLSNGIFIMVIDAELDVANIRISDRDGLGIWNTSSVKIKVLDENSSFLIMEVPMEL